MHRARLAAAAPVCCVLMATLSAVAGTSAAAQGESPPEASVEIEVSWADPQLVVVQYEAAAPEGSRVEGWHGCAWDVGGRESQPLVLSAPGVYTVSAYFLNRCLDTSDAGAENPDPYGAYDTYPDGSSVTVTARIFRMWGDALVGTETLTGEVPVSGGERQAVDLGTVTVAGPAAEGPAEGGAIGSEADFSCEPVGGFFYCAMQGACGDLYRISAPSCAFGVSVDLVAGGVSFTAHATASAEGVPSAVGTLDDRRGVFDSSGEGVISDDWWFQASGDFVAQDTMIGSDGGVYPSPPWQSGSTMVGYVSDDGTRMELCWREEAYGLSLGEFQANGREGFIDLCANPPGGAGYGAFPGAFTCTAVGEPLTGAGGAGPGDGGGVTLTSAAGGVVSGGEQSNTIAGDEGVGSVPAAQPEDGDEPTESDLPGLVVWLGIVLGVGAAALLMWAILRTDLAKGLRAKIRGAGVPEPADDVHGFAAEALSLGGREPPPPPPPPVASVLALEPLPTDHDPVFIPGQDLRVRAPGGEQVVITGGQPYHCRVRDSHPNQALVWVPHPPGFPLDAPPDWEPDPRGGDWIPVDLVHVDPTHPTLQRLARFTPDGTVPPPPPSGVDLGVVAQTDLQPKEGGKLRVFQAPDPGDFQTWQSPREVVLEPGTYLTAKPVTMTGGRKFIPLYNHHAGQWCWLPSYYVE